MNRVDAFLFAADAVLPILLMTVLGWLLGRTGLCPKDFAGKLNKMCFRVFLPTMLACNLYSGGGVKPSDAETIGFVFTSCIVMFLVGLFIVFIFIKEPERKGVVLQCAFRSNFAIIGLPLAQSIAGAEGARLAAVASAVSIPIFNIFAVISLSVFRGKSDAKKVDILKILKGIVTNPLIIGIICGLLMTFIDVLFAKAGINFRIQDIKPVYSVMKQLAAVTTPAALIALGARFEFEAVKRLAAPITVGTLSRLVIMPAIVLGGAYLFFPEFTSAHYAMLLALSGSPVALSSAVMASEMDADSELAGQLVVWTTLFSMATVFLTVTLFRAVGIF